MKIWVITDTHFNHTQRMMDLCGRPADYEQRLFDAMMAIPAEDVLIHLGDVALGNEKEMHEKYIKPLQCKKWLARGNHDSKSNKWYLENGWDFVAYEIRDKYFGKKVVFTHIPIAADGVWEKNIHGHFHNTTHRSQEPAMVALYTENHIKVAVEETDYKPVLLENLLKL